MEKLIKLEKLPKKTNMYDEVFRCGRYISNGAFCVDESLTDIGKFIVSEECVKCINPEWSYKLQDEASIARAIEMRDSIAIEPDNQWVASDKCINRHGKTWLRIFNPVNDIGHNEEALLLNEEYVKSFELDCVYANDNNSMCRDESGQILVMPCRF